MRFTCIDFALRIMALGVVEWKRHHMELAKMHGRVDGIQNTLVKHPDFSRGIGSLEIECAPSRT